jgi:hypothetical protein
MIALLAFLVAVLAVAWIVPTIAATVARNVVSGLDRSPASGSIDQSMVEARLGRIEEAIDAMALEIERLSDQQRALLGPADPRVEDADRSRTETPR